MEQHYLQKIKARCEERLREIGEYEKERMRTSPEEGSALEERELGKSVRLEHQIHAYLGMLGNMNGTEIGEPSASLHETSAEHLSGIEYTRTSFGISGKLRNSAAKKLRQTLNAASTLTRNLAPGRPPKESKKKSKKNRAMVTIIEIEN